MNFQAITIQYRFALKYPSKSHVPVKGQIRPQPKWREILNLVVKMRSS